LVKVLLVVVLMLAIRVTSLGGRVGTLERDLSECRGRAVDLKRDHDALSELLDAEREAVTRKLASGGGGGGGEEGGGGELDESGLPRWLSAVHLGGGKNEPVVARGKEAGTRDLHVLAARFRAAEYTLGELQEVRAGGEDGSGGGSAGDPGLELEDALGLAGGRAEGGERRGKGPGAKEVHRALDEDEVAALDAARSAARDTFFAEAEAWLEGEAAKVEQQHKGRGRGRGGAATEGRQQESQALRLEWGDEWGKKEKRGTPRETQSGVLTDEGGSEDRPAEGQGPRDDGPAN